MSAHIADAGEQGLTADEKELIATRNAHRALEMQVAELNTQLAAAHAREAALREAGRLLRIEGTECLGKPDRCDAKAPCGLCVLCAAMEEKPDHAALREFGLKVGNRVAFDGLAPQFAVDAVLKGGA